MVIQERAREREKGKDEMKGEGEGEERNEWKRKGKRREGKERDRMGLDEVRGWKGSARGRDRSHGPRQVPTGRDRYQRAATGIIVPPSPPNKQT